MLLPIAIKMFIFSVLRSKYKEPSLKEGFTEILKINFIPKFKSKHEEDLFKRFLIEK